MIKKLFARWFVKPEVIVEEIEEPSQMVSGMFTTDSSRRVKGEQLVQLQRQLADAHERTFQRKPSAMPNMGMDDVDGGQPISTKSIYGYGGSNLPVAEFLWYGLQGFIGYQACAMLSQNWLISKACTMPAKDAIRKGFEITVNNGVQVKPEILDRMRELDKQFCLTDHLKNFVRQGRIYGIRIAKFVVDSTDPDYYEKPFNPDGVTPGSYRGIVQIDPQWTSPQLVGRAATEPGAIGFYEPLFWLVNGKPIHRSHLIIFRTEEVVDILKPSYLYGGVSIPQKIYERVYAAERTANEAPMLALSKRTKIVKVDMAAAIADQVNFTQKMQEATELQNNFGYQILDTSEDMNQFDTSLNDLDAVIMTQYQLVAAIANVPAVKLMGTTPKGFNSTGESEEASYHEELETVQTHDLTPFVDRHHQLVIRSYIVPEFKVPVFETSTLWNPLDAMTAVEQAELNKLKADTGQTLTSSGAIDGADERMRIINDPASGYTGISDELPEPDFTDEEPNGDEEIDDAPADEGEEEVVEGS